MLEIFAVNGVESCQEMNSESKHLPLAAQMMPSGYHPIAEAWVDLLAAPCL